MDYYWKIDIVKDKSLAFDNAEVLDEKIEAHFLSVRMDEVKFVKDDTGNSGNFGSFLFF